MRQDQLQTLLSPFGLPGGRKIRNRIVMPPLVIWRAGESALVTDAHLRHYSESVPGTGLAIVEATTVAPEGRLAATQLGLFNDAQIPGMGDLARALRRAGALPGIQLHHAGGRTDTDKTYGLNPVAPSPTDNPDVLALDEEGIYRILGAFTAAARRAVDAGFELLELHGAHGYLGSQFLSPLANRREDDWGGSPEKRRRFLLELVRRVRQEIDDAALLSVRLGVAEGAEGGLTVDEGVTTARALEAEGLDLIHVSHAGSSPDPLEPDSSFDPVLQLAGPIKANLSIPVIGVGGVTTPEQGEAALREGYCDLIATGRAILADPGFARKTVEGKRDQIVECRRCKPRCHHHTNPKLCPTRQRLGIQPPGM